MKLIKRVKKFLSSLRDGTGFTLPEVTAVVAITGTLAAVIVPVAVDQIEKGRFARAAMDVDSISSAASAFFRDTGEWPDRKGTTPDFYYVLRSGNTVATFDLFSTTPTTGNVKDPGVGLTNWNSFAGTSGRADAMVNHLTFDNPGNLGTTTNGYREQDVNWNGPYMPQVFNDPWGRNYLVYARAFYAPSVSNIGTSGETGFVQGGNIFVWVISGGPNKVLETNVTSPILNDEPQPEADVSTVADDVGKMMFKAREAIAGVTAGS